MTRTALRRAACACGLVLAACGGSDDGLSDDEPVCTTSFLHGRWAIDDLSPCFQLDATDHVIAASSTVMAGAQTMCPDDASMVPDTPWSTDMLTADTAGHYRLCLTLKAGDVNAPQPSDCTIVTTCAEDDYVTAGAAQAWAALPAWSVTDAAALACATTFTGTGGYAELSVEGTATGCGTVTGTFHRIGYCPLSCGGNPGGPGCDVCGLGGDGSF
ncbi:MAG TPA: hypothetical protein VHE35_30755 [Kofleriaceae bacterium]|nr:hypothetical protein [Kofleriaceae bacterium]